MSKDDNHNISSKEQALSLKALENLRLRLLDLTARNRLINFRHTKTGSLRIIDELPNQLVEKLLSDTEMRFLPIPEPTEKELIEAGYLKIDVKSRQIVRLRKDPTADEWAKHLSFDTGYEVPEPKLNNDSGKHLDTAIQTLLYPYEMEARLKNLLQTAETAIQEMGANILYLAFGFLEWYDINNTDNERIAPLFLVPVRLHKGRLNKETRAYDYTLTYSGEDIIPNLSLREKLRVDFAMALPDLDENTVPEDYFMEVQELIADKQPRWKLLRYVSLALLNFSKLLMYLDLDPGRWPDDTNIINHPVVKRFLVGYEQGAEAEDSSNKNYGFSEEYLIDETDGIHVDYPLIDNADSSQHSALIDAINGKNLVIEGPPGTGKSQTITNLIAAAMSQGKRVLFVAEKLAALEVVRSRLDAARLGEFCLELHSHKSQKNKILNEVNERQKKHGRYRKPKDIDADIDRYENLKSELKEHAEKINRPWKKTGKTLHEIFMAATRYRNTMGINPEAFHPKGFDGSNYDAATQRRNKDQVEAYRKVYQAVAAQLEGSSDLQEHPWCGVRNSDLQIFDLIKVKESLCSWQESLQGLNEERKKIVNIIGCKPEDIGETVNDLTVFLSELESIPAIQGDEILERLSVLRGDVLEKTQRYLELFLDIQASYASMTEQVGSEILEDLTIVHQLLKGSEQLKQLVGQGIELGHLADAINRLNAVQGQLEQLNNPFNGLIEALGETAAKHIIVSESGIAEFKIVVELISILNPSYWEYRDELFDNEELDDLLPQMRLDFDELQGLHESVHRSFTLATLPSESEIRQLQRTLSECGLFRWFKGGWRDARKQVLSHASNPKIKLSSLLPCLGDLADFVDKRQKFENNKRYRKAFGDQMQGLDTDVVALESLRVWYKQVRRQYGFGFGQKVSIGNAILGLPPNIAKAVRSLSAQGIQDQLVDLINELRSLKDVFAPVVKLRNPNTLLIGEEGVIPNLLRDLNDGIRACSPLAEDNSLTMADLADRTNQIVVLKQKIDRWEKAAFDQKLFKGQLGLNIGVDVDNRSGLSALNNTLKLAAHVEDHLNNKKLAEYIYKNPVRFTFESLASNAQSLHVATNTQEGAYNTFNSLVQLDRDSWTARSSEQIENLVFRNQRALDNGEALQNWLDYVRIRDQVENLGIGRLVDSVEKKELSIDYVEDAYQASVFDMLSREILKENPELGRFSGRSQEALQDKFKEYDNKLMKLQCEQIAWKIDQTKIPTGFMGARVSELTESALLERECSKKTRHIPIRQLLQRAGKALAALKPCFMMGPMSVAQYLAPGRISFDLVIMDEASQIKPQDALGAIGRGTQLVVVGDPKQLPPTSFFDRIIDEEDEDPTAIEESESILDATLPMFPARRLRWHYRSQHESLIAFSNHSFYESDLVLFPSPHKQTENYGIQLSRVPRGCFVNRRNMEEAKMISEAVREHFRYHPEDSLGVVTMSAEQRLQIERAIDTLSKDDPVFQGCLEKDSVRQESLFIKNLENVQGDERDVIFISMTYGPQEPGGKVLQRFGPINYDVGWRRLNVLFTRSKKRMHIFSSMGSEDIVVGATSKRGVQALRDFLSFCETGILHKTERDTGRAPDSDFEIAVMDALRKEGFECIPQVGVAGFFIDVAVVDPGRPGRYLMGIECDGATYHSAKSVRDRDHLRQTILERLGWNIRRIWSTDWFKNPHGELRPIIRDLHLLKSVVMPVESEIESEIYEIDGINKEGGSQEVNPDVFASEGGSLMDKLIRFDQDVIRKEHPNTSENNRLLRPAMLEALLEYTPTSKGEFLEMIPSYIRQATTASEGKYLAQIFDIINSSLENTTPA